MPFTSSFLQAVGFLEVITHDFWQEEVLSAAAYLGSGSKGSTLSEEAQAIFLLVSSSSKLLQC